MTIASDNMKGKIVFVPTYEDNPEPFFPGQAQDLSEAARSNRWKMLNEKLLSFGVEEVLLGGQHLIVESVNNGEARYDKCVAWAREAMQPSFKVTLSAINWPDRPIRS